MADSLIFGGIGMWGHYFDDLYLSELKFRRENDHVTADHPYPVAPGIREFSAGDARDFRSVGGGARSGHANVRRGHLARHSR
jgi:hypothetical protein